MLEFFLFGFVFLCFGGCADFAVEFPVADGFFQGGERYLWFFAFGAGQAKVRLVGSLGSVVEEAFVDVANLLDVEGAEAETAGFFRTFGAGDFDFCLLYTSPSPRDQRGSRMPSSA